MSEIKQWAVNICITLAATAVFSMLVPNGSMEKVLKFTISLFFVCCLLTPFLVGLPQIDWEAQTTYQADYTWQCTAIERRAFNVCVGRSTG